MRKLIIGILMATFVVSQGFASTIITTATGEGADSHIDQGNPAGNFGANEYMQLKDAASGRFRKSYLKFDISSFGETEIAEATLDMVMNVYLTPAVADFTVGVYGIVDSVDLDGWGEMTITGQNAPANSTTNNGFNVNSVYLGDIVVPYDSADGTTYSFSNQNLVDWLNTDTDGLVTVALNVTTGNSETLLIASKENTTYDAPSLTLVPEPATFALLGSAGLLFFRRKK